jgi:hypothetical protein
MDNLAVGNVVFLLALEESALPSVVQRPFFALWKSFRNDRGQRSEHRQKVTGMKSESVTGIIPES